MPPISARFWSRRWPLALVASALAVASAGGGRAVAARQSVPPGQDGVAVLVQRIEQVVAAGDPAGFMALLGPGADRAVAAEFLGANLPQGVTRAVVRERDRGPLKGTPDGAGYQLLLELFIETGNRAGVSTWRVDVRRADGSEGPGWAIVNQEMLTTLQGLHRLSLNGSRRYTVRNASIVSEDLRLLLRHGSVYAAETSTGPTALVFIGSGEMVFRPGPAAERDQVRIFAGSDTLTDDFSALFIRLNPSEIDSFFIGATTPAESDAKELARADAFFREQLPKSYSLDLSEMSDDLWSLIPTGRDVLAEIATRRRDTLTYARSNAEPEDVTLFDRKRRRNIALYPSKEKLAARGGFYDEDDLADADVIEYDITAAIAPDRQLIEGRTAIRMVTLEPSLASLTLTLAESLKLRSVVSSRYGRLLAVKIRNQNRIVINLPEAVPKGTELLLAVEYGGRLPPQSLDREVIALDRGGQGQEPVIIPMEESYLYSNRSYWYPQAPSGDYATAMLRITVPAGFGAVASGQLISNAGESPQSGPRLTQGPPPRTFLFRTGEPARYFSCIVSRFQSGASTEIGAPGPRYAKPGEAGSEEGYANLTLRTETNPRQGGRSRGLIERSTDILQFYASLLGDFPYPTLTAALVESELPGGHSPAYMMVLNQPVPGLGQGSVWYNDPASFNDFPEFFLAHELAHQWWGQAVGWKNYHEQWLSEGLAQYFAVLYAGELRGPDRFERVMRQLQSWALRESDKGAIYLGYRVGHIQGDSRLFRAVVYNKSAAVLHMLRRLVGDEPFFRGLRRFYREWRYLKAGSEDLRAAMEAETGQPLGRFFTRWIYNTAIPEVRFTWREAAGAGREPSVLLRFEQQGEVFDLPVLVRIERDGAAAVDALVKVTDKVVEQEVPVTGRITRVTVNSDGAAVARFRK